MAIQFFEKEMEKILLRFQEVYQEGKSVSQQEFAKGLIPQLIGIGDLVWKRIKDKPSKENVQEFYKRRDLIYDYLSSAEQQFALQDRKAQREASRGKEKRYG
jgi:hypothetical protein